MKCYAALLDTRSIQKYIFAGNKLKTNVGASYLVDQIYSKELVDVLKSAPFNFDIAGDSWKQPGPIAMETNPNLACEIAYVGGGNAIVLFKEDGVAKKVVAELTKRLLVKDPGLKTGAALGELRLGEGEAIFKEDIDKLYQTLKDNQNNIVPDVSVPYTGLTLECEISGDAASVYDKKFGKKPRYISAETYAKLDVSEEAQDELENKFSDIIGQYKFPDDLEHMGQKTGEEYIAIVHVDGNDMGSKFSRASSLTNRKKLSIDVASKSLKAFRRLLGEVVVPEYNKYEKIMSSDVRKDNILPIRPIILGGDDITFVCPARMSIIYTQRLIEFMQEETLDYPIDEKKEPKDDGKFYACGGIAILPTKYPFFRGYELAEQACGVAKEKSREDGKSWLDFVILHGEQAPTLKQIREQEYKAALGGLHYGPYKVAGIEQANSIERLLLGAKELKEEWPSSKIKAMRDVIRKGGNEIDIFLKQLDHLNLRLPTVDNKHDIYKGNLWSKGKDEKYHTPYLDMIEIIDFMYDSGEA